MGSLEPLNGRVLSTGRTVVAKTQNHVRNKANSKEH